VPEPSRLVVIRGDALRAGRVNELLRGQDA